MAESLPLIDHSALRTNQAVIITLLVAAFILNLPWLVGLTAFAMLTGAALKQPAFGLLYHHLLMPRKWVKPEILADNAEPHRFAQGLGGLFLAGSALTLYTGGSILGWSLSWLVIGLAALNLLAGFCVGCALYYWLNRLSVPGFNQSAPAGVPPGKRPGR